MSSEVVRGVIYVRMSYQVVKDWHLHREPGCDSNKYLHANDDH